MDPDVLAAAKLLTGRDRLRILGRLARGLADLDELLESTGLAQVAVRRELALLTAAGLVEQTRLGPTERTHYELSVSRLNQVGAALAQLEADQEIVITDLPDLDAAAIRDWPKGDLRVLRAYLDHGRIKAIPAQHAKRMVVVRFLAVTAFEPGESYTERDVNMRLALRHPDVAALRRYLVDEGLVQRVQGIYRLTARGEALAQVTAPSPA
jgi:DNA-binding HxlR family transcriptional regulator